MARWGTPPAVLGELVGSVPPAGGHANSWMIAVAAVLVAVAFTTVMIIIVRRSLRP